MDGLTIGQVARATRVGVDTVRFYEREGLLARPVRTAAGYRQYTMPMIADVEQRVATLMRMKRALAKLASSCSGRGPTSECPILEALESRELAP